MAITALELLISLLVLLYGLISVNMLGIYLWGRYSRSVRESYTVKLCECLQPQDHLPDVVFPDAAYSFNRRVLIRLMIDLSTMLEGVEGRILRLIFLENGLDYHILHECRYRNDFRKIQALSVFIDIPVSPELMNELNRFLNSRNNELRMVALLVWLNLEPETMLERLARYPHELSDRDCANIYALAQRRYIPVSDAEKLIGSPNPSVIRFGENVLRINGL